MEPTDKPVSLIELKQDYHELNDGVYFCWWYNMAQFGYQVGDDTYGYKGVVFRSEDRALLTLDDYKHSTVVLEKDVGVWNRINALRCLQIIQSEVVQLENKEGVKPEQLTFF